MNLINSIDLVHIAKPYIPIVLLVGLLLAVRISFSLPSLKGWVGEKLVEFLILKRLNRNSYKVFSDVYIPRPDKKGTTQIDHIIVSKFGIFVIETKNFSHWIFGSDKQKEWTQQVYRKKYKFQNPLHQNKLHITALSNFLQLPQSIFHNVVFFIGSCTFKTKLPNNVIQKGLYNYIASYQSDLISIEQVEVAIKALNNHLNNTDKASVALAHKKFLKNR